MSNDGATGGGLVSGRAARLRAGRWRRRSGPATGSCSRCLRQHREESCPFRTKQRFRYGWRGHIRAVRDRCSQQYLRQLKEGDAEPGRRFAAAAKLFGMKSALLRMHVHSLFSLRRETSKRRPPLIVDVKPDGRPIKMEVDTGAALSI